jgi:hypothetical protein
MLRSRLVSRGAALSTTMAVMSASMTTAQAAAPPILISHTAALGAGFALKLSGAGAKATAAKGGAATILAEKGILAMTIAAASKPAVAVLGVCLAAGMLAVATADAPKDGGQGGVDGGVAVVLLADSDAGESPGGEVASADVDAEFAANADADADADVDGESSNGDANSIRGTITFAAPTATVSGIPATVPAVPAQPATATIPSPPTESATSRAPGLTPSERLQAGWWKLASTGESQPTVSTAPQTISLVANESTLTNRPHAAGASEASLKLEAEYWAIKGRALKKKAEAIAAHAKAASESGEQSTTETAAAEAEADLMLAEVKLCELNALRVSETLGAVEVGKLKWGDKSPRVSALQRALNARVTPSPKLDVDGEFGGLTQKAVMSFQKAHGLKADGKVDAATAAALGSWELAAPHSAFDLSQSVAGEARRQQALIQAKVLEAQSQAKHAEAKAKEMAKAAVAAAEQSIKATVAGSIEPKVPRTVTIELGDELRPDEAARAFNEAIRKLQEQNAKLQKQLKELEESHRTSRY